MKDCEQYDHIPEQYDGAFWRCKVCDAELTFIVDTSCNHPKRECTCKEICGLRDWIPSKCNCSCHQRSEKLKQLLVEKSINLETIHTAAVLGAQDQDKLIKSQRSDWQTRFDKESYDFHEIYGDEETCVFRTQNIKAFVASELSHREEEVRNKVRKEVLEEIRYSMPLDDHQLYVLDRLQGK